MVHKDHEIALSEQFSDNAKVDNKIESQCRLKVRTNGRYT